MSDVGAFTQFQSLDGQSSPLSGDAAPPIGQDPYFDARVDAFMRRISTASPYSGVPELLETVSEELLELQGGEFESATETQQREVYGRNRNSHPDLPGYSTQDLVQMKRNISGETELYKADHKVLNNSRHSGSTMKLSDCSDDSPACWKQRLPLPSRRGSVCAYAKPPKSNCSTPPGSEHDESASASLTTPLFETYNIKSRILRTAVAPNSDAGDLFQGAFSQQVQSIRKRILSSERSSRSASPTNQTPMEQYSPFWAMKKRDFHKLKQLMTHKEAQKSNLLVLLNPAELEENTVLFGSHRWVQRNDFDDDPHSKLVGIRMLLNFPAFQKVKYVWIDSMCVPEKQLMAMRTAIGALHVRARRRMQFVVLVAEKGKNRRTRKTLHDYLCLNGCTLEDSFQHPAKPPPRPRAFLYNLYNGVMREMFLKEHFSPVFSWFVEGASDDNLQLEVGITSVLEKLCSCVVEFSCDKKLQEIAGHIQQSVKAAEQQGAPACCEIC